MPQHTAPLSQTPSTPALQKQVVDDGGSNKMLLVMDYLEGGPVMTREGLGECTHCAVTVTSQGRRHLLAAVLVAFFEQGQAAWVLAQRQRDLVRSPCISGWVNLPLCTRPLCRAGAPGARRGSPPLLPRHVQGELGGCIVGGDM